MMSEPVPPRDVGSGRKQCFRRNAAFLPPVSAKAVLPVFLLLALLCMGSGGSFGSAAPRFSWGAFQRFWNTSAVLGSEITVTQPVREGYLISFGSAAGMVVLAEGEMVSGVRVEFMDAPGNEPGGRLFLRAMDSAIRVGTYRWPEERREAVFRKFENMTPEPVRYQWKTSRFTRERLASGMWVFTLEFVADQNPGGGA